MNGNKLNEGFNGNIQTAFHVLMMDWLMLEGQGTAGESRMQELMEFERKCIDLCGLLHEFADSQSALLRARTELRSKLVTVSLSEEAKRIWMADQIAFYSVWIKKTQIQLERRREVCTLNIPARELLLLLRLFRDMDLLEQVSLKSMFGFICDSFRTVNQGQLSYESLRKKYSDFDPISIRKIRKLLAGMNEKLDAYKTSY
ncbi:MAG: hypothetical protein LBF27_21595 [Sphingobacterium sp.]|jgi:hypothetical protein|nr:hypothetical protein [Sphingobacterium sp.]